MGLAASHLKDYRHLPLACKVGKRSPSILDVQKGDVQPQLMEIPMQMNSRDKSKACPTVFMQESTLVVVIECLSGEGRS